ncbi:hypothetical protein GCK32_003484 [Trichostrongylus colubriformis]|uniref:Uncharacterized protein n=1 Tax=Trichostrongylus colubriformis TaxID=6319 RepID=A0AAN8F2F2_TRICO
MECDGNVAKQHVYINDAVYYLVDAERGVRFCVLRDCGIPLLNEKLSAHPSAQHSRSPSPQREALEQDNGEASLNVAAETQAQCVQDDRSRPRSQLV